MTSCVWTRRRRPLVARARCPLERAHGGPLESSNTARLWSLLWSSADLLRRRSSSRARQRSVYSRTKDISDASAARAGSLAGGPQALFVPVFLDFLLFVGGGVRFSKGRLMTISESIFFILNVRKKYHVGTKKSKQIFFYSVQMQSIMLKNLCSQTS